MRGKEFGQTLGWTSTRKEKVQKVRMKKEVSQLPRFIVPSGSWAPTHLTGGGARGQTNSNVSRGHASATDDQTGPGVRP